MEWVGYGTLLGVALWLLWLLRSSIAQGRREQKNRFSYQESVDLGIQPASLHPKIDLNRCIGSGSCVDACPEVDVLGLIDGKARLVNPSACIGHSECLKACPVDAIQLVMGTEKSAAQIPALDQNFQTNVPGIFIVGELSGMGLIYNAMTQAMQCVAALVKKLPKEQEGFSQVAIVGAGPAGLAASVCVKAKKLSYVTLEQESIGGTVLHYPRHKIVMTRPVKLPLYGKLKLTSVHKEDLLKIWHDIIETTGVQIREGVKVEGVRKIAGGFELSTTQGTVRAQRVIFALGRRGSPRKLDIPGEELGKVAYRLLEPETYRGKRCMVVGGGDAGVEAALALGECGAHTHLVYRKKVFARIKSQNRERLEAANRVGTVTSILGAQPTHIHADHVEINRDGQAESLPNDYIWVFAGGVLPTAFLQNAGVEIQEYRGDVYAPAN
jgi:thioredoxin reductase (NADPH)